MIDLNGLSRENVLVIAEIGCNHNGDMGIARDLVRAAAGTGADVAKFQTFDPARMSVRTAPKADYQRKATGDAESQYDRLKRMMLTRRDHEDMVAACAEAGLAFCSSPFDLEAVDLLEGLGVSLYKLPSGEITNFPLLRAVGATGKPVIMSTGMSDLDEVERALDQLVRSGAGQVALLHCLSNYPADPARANLRAMVTMAEAFRVPVGLSDHTPGADLAVMAVALGGVVIEKHITLDRTMEGGDHLASLEPDAFRDMVERVRLAGKALGDGVKRCDPSEENVRAVARKSLVAARDLAPGERLTADMLACKRPGTGLSPALLDQLVGRIVARPVSADSLLGPQDLESQPGEPFPAQGDPS